MRHDLTDTWTRDEIDFLRASYIDVPASEIGRKLGRTKNAVIGKARRLGLSVPRGTTLARIAAPAHKRKKPSLRQF